MDGHKIWDWWKKKLLYFSQDVAKNELKDEAKDEQKEDEKYWNMVESAI